MQNWSTCERSTINEETGLTECLARFRRLGLTSKIVHRYCSKVMVPNPASHLFTTLQAAEFPRVQGVSLLLLTERS